jgi:hypothetical protein
MLINENMDKRVSDIVALSEPLNNLFSIMQC